ncbi:hypothetical protein ACKLNR_012391 [Fusarium oxysporum f. sp. zingiberi]
MTRQNGLGYCRRQLCPGRVSTGGGRALFSRFHWIGFPFGYGTVQYRIEAEAVITDTTTFTTSYTKLGALLYNGQ